MTIRPLPITLAAMLAAALPAAPALAQQSSVEYFTRSHAAALPQLLSNDDRAFYGSLFEAIDSRNWDRVEVMLAGRTDGPLHGAALASYYLHPQSPRIELGRIESWLDRYARLPAAEAIVRLGQTRGLDNPPSLPRARDLVRQPGSTKRIRPSAINDGTMPESVKAAILERITNDDPDGARLLLDGVDATLSSQARAEWRYRVAWSYYIENQDAQAWALADTARDGGSGAWVAEGDWAAGLAAWRLGDCDKAAEAFQRSAAGAASPNLAAAAHYWASRALIRCRFPEKADEQLRGAARFPETLYGMLAHEQMGRDLPRTHAQPDLTEADWRRLRDKEAARQAVMLAEIGRREEAERDLTWLVRTGDPDDYGALSRLARALGLTGAQTFMAYNAPRGEGAHSSLRYPVTFRTPVGGWRVDPALAFAHALQESNFRERVVSPAGAIGLMQIMPITQREYAASINMSSGADLKDPAVNLAFGQRTLESLGSSNYTQGRLPKVMAAYNAGPSPVSRWESEIRDQGDPLLYMESIPYWETRGYVAIVMRNYWMYLRQADAAAPSRIELAENDWPMFPGVR
ncbi:lytic transglycosylase domain-containing protein [Qipengyuania sp. SS22]|uniref:lytic transglycosylase domain-containing protein n=1 Tax=Qipengyuania sp. SS22 TaxID=2979461 RepID=UPI0021E602D1|nr:lytic transglycosylase domain-containing protein [Qipengyuania sp. SS22]UYH55947.1 lytic transglycosylase domain-containing protein [Qipengyuania sp. SS22]